MSDKPEHIGLDNKPAAERDRIDLNHEIAGVSTGRIKRFLSENHLGINNESDKKKSERRFRTMLAILLAEDAQYAKLYFEAKETLDKARRAANQALINIHRRLENSERKLHILRDNATRLDDGTMVFLSTADGHVYTEDGRKLSDEDAQKIEFSEDSPSWEDYKSTKDSHNSAIKQKSEIETYQRNVLDRTQERPVRGRLS